VNEDLSEGHKRNIKKVINEALNGAFKVIKITNEIFNKDFSKIRDLNLFYERQRRKVNDVNASPSENFNKLMRNIIFVEEIKEMIRTELTKYFINETKYKIIANVNINYTMLNLGTPVDTFHYNSITKTMVGLKQIADFTEDIMQGFIKAIEIATMDSNLTFLGINAISINFARRTKTRAGSYVDILPDSIKNKKAIVNIKNLKDDKCIIWCLVAHKYYDTFKSDKCDLYNYKKHEDEIIKPKDIVFPINIQENIPQFEKLNDIKINIYEYNKDFTHLEPLYNNKKIYSNEVDLLLMKKDDIEHLASIRDINRLFIISW